MVDRFAFQNEFPSVTFAAGEALVACWTARSGLGTMNGEVGMKLLPLAWFPRPDPRPAR